MTPRPLIWRRMLEGLVMLVLVGMGTAMVRDPSPEFIADSGICVLLTAIILWLLYRWSKEQGE